MLSVENIKHAYIINMMRLEFLICIVFVSLGEIMLIDDFCYWQLICRFLQVIDDNLLNEIAPSCCCQKRKIGDGGTVG